MDTSEVALIGEQERRRISVFVGACGLLALMNSKGLRALSWPVLGMLSLAGVILLGGLMRGLLTRLIEPGLSAWSPRARRAWVLGSLGAAGLVLAMIPLRVTPPQVAHGAPGVVPLLWCGTLVSVGLLVLLGGLWLTSRPARPWSAPARRWSWGLYALPCVLVWSVWWLVFWPGLMSGDSLNQWLQLTTGQYSDVHPVFHTFSNQVLTRPWHSPAMVAGAQVLALAGAVG